MNSFIVFYFRDDGSENTTLVFFAFYFCKIITINNDLTKIERKKTSVVFSEPFISEIGNYEAIYSNDLTKIECKKKVLAWL
jgi:hypothetical protein